MNHAGSTSLRGENSLRGELDNLELGGRAGWWLAMFTHTAIYGTPRERVLATVMTIVDEVAAAARDRGESYPGEWLPDSTAWDASSTYPL